MASMYALTAQNAAEYLLANGRIAPGENTEVCELSGGVSNAVLLVTLPRRSKRFVIKQARTRLKVEQEWLASAERLWREVEVLRLCDELLGSRRGEGGTPGGLGTPASSIVARIEPCVPRVLWEDRDNYLFAMAAAPEGHHPWKELLLAGQTRQGLSVAIACGQLLARLHAGSWQNAEIAQQLDDRTFFDELRIDPYYRRLATQHPDLAPAIERLIDAVWQHRLCLVHGDFSPKNLLVWGGEMMLIDFEVGHFGDPAFDLGFFLSHLVLKGVRSGPHGEEYVRLATVFWTAYQHLLRGTVRDEELAALERRAMFNLAGCLLARVDGKSPVDYLSPDQQDQVRRMARAWLLQAPPTWNAAAEELAAIG
jgi:5-methylthioribose kinase